MSTINKLKNKLRDKLGYLTLGLKEYTSKHGKELFDIHNDYLFNDELFNEVEQLINENSFLNSELEKCLNNCSKNNIATGITSENGRRTLERIRNQTLPYKSRGGKKLKKKNLES